MSNPPVVVYDSVTKTHRPLGAGESIDTSNIGISGVGYNVLRNFPDGLYVGPLLPQPVFYVAAAGVDGPPNDGSKALPFKTIEYVLEYLVNLDHGIYTSSVIVALKAGETFVTVNSLSCYGNLQLTFYGDPNYGDFNSPLVNGTTVPGDMADLQRPIINVGIASGTSGQAGFVLIQTPGSVDREIILQGIQLNLPAGNHLTGAVDFISGLRGTRTSLQLLGAIINVTDNTAIFGLLGLECGSWGNVYQRCSQLRINNILVSDATSTPNLLARKWLFKFYPDYRGAGEEGLELFGGAPGSALMNLSWSDVASNPVGTSSSLGTYPLLQDPNFGLANYFFNLTRDQQNRPLNVSSGRLF